MKKKILPILLVGVGVLLVASSFLTKGNAKGELTLDIVKTETLMPAAHNVYSNEEALDGKYYLFKAKLTNETNATLEDVIIRYRIPGYIEWTELGVIGEMFSGQTASVRAYPKFNEEIAKKMTESVEKAEIEISWDGAEEDDIIEEAFSFRIADRNEFKFTNVPAAEIIGWADVHNNTELLACFVTPNDPIVKYYTQNIQEKMLKGESAGVTKDPKEAVRFLTGIYEATRQSHMVYSGTKMIPENLTDISKFSQSNRLPREVITGNTGLCLELSLLYASVLSSAGIDPIIFLVPGHAYPGFKMNGQYYAIEATGIGGEGLGGIQSVEKAFETGMKSLNEFFNKQQQSDVRYKMVDIHIANQQGATPMVLKDDAFLRKKVDEMVAAWGGGVQKPSTQKVTYKPSGNTTPTPRRSSSLSVTIPSSWQTVRRPLADVPILTASAIAPDQTTSISVFDVPTNDVGEAMNVIKNYLYNYGQEIVYQFNGNQVSGQTYSNMGTLNWVGKTLRHTNGIRIVTVGAPDYLYAQNSNLINQLFNTIK